MPKSKEYLSSSDSEESGDSDEPKQKKKKPEAKPEKKEAKPEKKDSKTDEKKAGPTKNSNGESMFQIGKMRYATVSEFRGKAMVSIREYYEKDGDLRPGKKGISLSVEQWDALKDKVSEIDECLSKL
ncbi:unnamed protein product [Lymnaea stagnalis]|uniref:Transcriptional coactivator p15 (PC4) C-terminal domain-containing protein n=1 Tax=Lymnaea stagnalis TaxID=6523 RepID=A0AAV2HNM6_LYMST